MTTDTGAHPRIRSYVLRAGRVGSGQARALAEIGPQFMLPYQPAVLDLDAVFGRAARQPPASWKSASAWAKGWPRLPPPIPKTTTSASRSIRPGVGALLKQIGERGLTNVRVIQHDAVEVLTHMLAPASLAGIHIFFPDPWHKKRHHKRRLIQPPLVSLLASRFSPAATSIWPPTGRTTPSRCSRCSPPSRCCQTPWRITRRAPTPARSPSSSSAASAWGTACGTWCSAGPGTRF